MWLFATIICQVVMTWMSSFPMAVGMMMVENIPFMHVIANVAVQGQGMGVDTFSTVLVTFALSSLVVGVCFYLLGHFEMGNAVYFVPRHVIVGCIGGIGIFLLILSTEVSTDSAWAWNIHTIGPFFNPPKLPLWLTSLFFALLLRGLMTKIKSPLLAPLFFISIPPAFYAILYLTGVSVADAHAKGWFFAGLAEEANPFLMWELIDIRTVNWISVVNSLPTIVALTIFSLMHVPINIPSLSISTNQPADMNKELKAHGVSNIISGVFGGLQNYLCYSNSVTYYKCNGGGKISGMLIAALTTLFFFVGPSVVVYVPRCMAGALLFHAGIDLSKEALVDTYDGLDAFEYGSVVAITAVMTIYGKRYLYSTLSNCYHRTAAVHGEMGLCS
jgi:SulP family sulfate permease